VAASICIPVFFQPRRDGDAWLVDGGLLSNFPAWVFDEELEEVNLNTPIIGFKLVERTAAPNLDSFYAFLKSVLTTAISGDEILETRRIDNLRLIRLQTDQSTFNFNLSPKDKENLYLSGIEDAKNCFKKDQGNPFNSDNIQPLLQMLCNGIRFDSDIHLRANVMLPVSRGRLRVNYGYNMENDTDDQLTIPITSRGAGECWRTGNLVVCNMEQVRGSSDKYIIALLRPSTNSLMSVPIPDIRHAPDDSGGYSRLLGVLNIDSDNDLLSYFTNRDVQQQALDAARLIATLLLAS
jgi:NTE family protein